MKLQTIVEIKRFRVKSKSEPNKFHEVTILSNDKLYCDCIAGRFAKPCRHKKLVEQKLYGNQ